MCLSPHEECADYKVRSKAVRRSHKNIKVSWSNLRSLGTKGTFFPLTFTGSCFCLHFPGGALLQKFNEKRFLTVIIH